MITYSYLKLFALSYQVNYKNQIKVQKLKTIKQSLNHLKTFISFKQINKLNNMSSNQNQIVYIVGRLKDWNEALGGLGARKKMAASQFDAWQQQFLIKRHETQKLQNQKQTQGVTTKTASHSYKIREGITQMETAIGKMKQENRKLAKKKDLPPEQSIRRQKIIQNCDKLFQDIKQRQKAFNDPNGFIKPTKVLTLTDMRSKLLSDIQQQNYQLHQPTEGSQDQLGDSGVEDQAMHKFAQKDKQMDNALDGIIDGMIGLTGKVKGINKKQDQVIQSTHKNNKKVKQVSNRIQTDNDKLKKIIKQFGPSRCCLSITLLLLFIGLIVVVIKMFVLG